MLELHNLRKIFNLTVNYVTDNNLSTFSTQGSFFRNPNEGNKLKCIDLLIKFVPPVFWVLWKSSPNQASYSVLHNVNMTLSFGISATKDIHLVGTLREIRA